MTRTVLVAGPPLAAEAQAFAQEQGVRCEAMEAYSDTATIARRCAELQPDALIVRMGKITEEIIDASKALRVIVKHGVGYDNIDLEAANRRGIPVLIARGTNAQSVAELAFALMFSVARSTPWLDARTRSGHWDKAQHTGIELMGKSLGVVGLGSIGLALARMVAPLNIKVRIFDPYLKGEVGLADAEVVDDLHELIRRSDIVSLHCPLTEATRNLIGAKELELLGPRGILINTARGGLIDEGALFEALATHRIAGAGLDTFAQEPPPKDSPLWTLPNLVATPHVGANTHESRARVGVRTLELALEVLEGKLSDPGSVVNAQALATA